MEKLISEKETFNNRRKTTGRRVHYQLVNGSSKRHISPSENQRVVQNKLAENALRIPKRRFASEKTLRKKFEKQRGVLIWNSSVNGTFYGNVKRDLIKIGA